MVRDEIDMSSKGAKRSRLSSHSSPSAWSRTSRRSGRGMVTAELSVSILTALALLTMMCWAIYLVVLQLRCIDTASEVARQAARGDRAAVHRDW